MRLLKKVNTTYGMLNSLRDKGHKQILKYCKDKSINLSHTQGLKIQIEAYEDRSDKSSSDGEFHPGSDNYEIAILKDAFRRSAVNRLDVPHEVKAELLSREFF